MPAKSKLEFPFPFPFVLNTKQETIPVIAITTKQLEKLKNKTDKKLLEANGFKGKTGQTYALFAGSGDLKKLYVGITDPMGLYDISHAAEKAKSIASSNTVFELSNITKAELETACIAWGLACHAKDRYKSEKNDDKLPKLLLPKEIDKERVKSHIRGICLVRDLINSPPNELGPAEMASTAEQLATDHKAKIKVVTNQKTLEKDYPLVHTVGKASDRLPCLIDLTWGKAQNPKITLIGKGVIFDSGGLNLKPGAYMKNMKKDMGGAAHVLGLAHMIMANKLPVRLRVIVPAVENAISGPAFRPGDILPSRKGLTVENKNTDAEGRLILADALTLASEEETDLIIDCATLTGSARAAMGPDVPPFFSTNPTVARELQAISFLEQDPMWHMPLIDHYNSFIESPIADLVNSVGVPGDLIFSALFLKKFLNGNPDWIHIDMNAWTDSNKAGRPAGGADCGLRSLYSYLEKRFSE